MTNKACCIALDGMLTAGQSGSVLLCSIEEEAGEGSERHKRGGKKDGKGHKGGRRGRGGTRRGGGEKSGWKAEGRMDRGSVRAGVSAAVHSSQSLLLLLMRTISILLEQRYKEHLGGNLGQ